MHPLLIEAVPASTFRSLPVALQVLLPIVAKNIVLSRYVEHLADLGLLEHLVYGVKLAGFREVADIAGVKQELRLRRGGIDPVNRDSQGGHYVRVGSPIEAHMAVA